MHSPYHPATHHELQRNCDSAAKSLWGLAGVCLGLLTLICVVDDQRLRLAIAAVGLGLSGPVSAPISKTLTANRRLLGDVENVHQSALTKTLYDSLTKRESAVKAVEPPALPPAPPPLRNLAQDIARFDPHVALVCESRSGKTTLLIGAIQEAQRMGHQVFLFDGKGDVRMEALQGVAYYKCNTASRAAIGLEVMRSLVAELAQRQDTHQGGPVSIYVDEWNLIRVRAKQYSKACMESWTESLMEILFQGAAEKFYARLSAHTSRVDDWGMNSGVLDSTKFVALGRDGNYDSIEDLIRYQISSSRESKGYQEALDSYREMSFSEPLALTTIPKRGFYRVPFSAELRLNSPQQSESVNSPQQSTFTPFRSGQAPFQPPADGVQDDLSDAELALQIIDSQEYGVASTTAFVEYFFGVGRGGSKAFTQARDRVNRVMEQEGISW